MPFVFEQNEWIMSSLIISIHLNVVNVCTSSAIISPLKREGPFIWTDLRSLSQKMLRQEIGLVFLNTRFIRWLQCIFITLLFPLLKWAGFFLSSNFNRLYPRALYVKFCWDWLNGSGKGCLQFVNGILIPLNLEKIRAIPMFPFNQGCFVPSSVEISQAVIE